MPKHEKLSYKCGLRIIQRQEEADVQLNSRVFEYWIWLPCTNETNRPLCNIPCGAWWPLPDQRSQIFCELANEDEQGDDMLM